MNILFLATFPFSNAGGVGRVTETLAREFQRRGHECVFLSTSPYSYDTVATDAQRYLPSHKIGSDENRRFLCRLVRDHGITVIVNQAGSKTDVLDLLQESRVHSEVAVFSVHHNCIACLQDNHESIINYGLDRVQVPRVLRPRMLYRLLKERSRIKGGKAFARAANESSRLVVLADSFIDELSVFSSNIDRDKVVAIFNPAPFSPNPEALSEKEDVLLFVGRLANGQKRVDRVLTAWAEVSREFPTWRLEIVGDGPDRNSLESKAHDMNLERINFRGYTNPVPFYKKARLLMLTSKFEGYGMVLVEAQAFGCVPVAFRCFSSIGEIIQDGENGYLVDQDDEDAYVSALRAAMDDRCTNATMAQQAISSIDKFSPGRIANQWLALFESVR